VRAAEETHAVRAAYENPRPDVQALVPRDARRILDLGCSSGALGAGLKARQPCEVVGVERDPRYATAARARLDDVIEEDLAAFDPDGLGRFDCVVAADVLEHLVDPWTVLRRGAAVLEPGGSAVVSLPNVRYWETFWQVYVRGTWPRRAIGLFDRTHLRWFTLADAWALLDHAGLTMEHVDRRLRLAPTQTKLDPLAQRTLTKVPGIRTLLTYQHVIRARA
jgi:methionine biosynthesis protein MetW